MKEEASNQMQQLAIRWIIVVIPTIIIGYISLRFLNFSYTAIKTGIISQTLYFGVALLISYSLYYYNARWLVTFILLWIAYGIVESMISKLPGEFDVFYATARFQLYSTLFIFGWVFGFLLARLRWAYIILFGVLAIVNLVTISDTIDISIEYILLHIAPVVVYGLYMLFITPLLSTNIQLNWSQSGKLVFRMLVLVLLILFAFIIVNNLLKGQVKAVEKELVARGAKGDKDGQSGGDGYDDRYGLMEKQKDDSYRLKDTMKVNSRMSSSDKLMFCSKLDNYFPDGSPAPLYYVYHYLTRYDSVKETFTRDVDVPSLDEFDVDPTELPMYYSVSDTSVIRKAKGPKLRKIVEAQVYLSENTWKHSVLGPANVFHIQTIPVEKDFQKTFLSAYKIYSYTSELNNAYFVYNISASPQLEDIQEERHEELRKIKNYDKIDREFFKYYTRLPHGGIYDSIADLAKSLVDMNARAVDKVLAVRDFFLQRNDYGKRVFRYTLQAGAVDDPNIPSSKMLYNFLFKTHAGYCTYYAGASLFMLRSLGIPVRFTTGFATVNRSDKNKGWYWFYASQAHAWTQVYFPEYGWMDFDMTIGNEDQQGAPKPDGTPPLPPPEPWLVLNAKIDSKDSVSKKLDASFAEMIFDNNPVILQKTYTKKIDASIVRVLYGERDTTLTAVHAGDSVVIVSYKNDFRKSPTFLPGVLIERQISGFPNPIIADEIHIRVKEKDQQEEDGGRKKLSPEERKINWKEIAQNTAIAMGGILLFIIFFPILFLLYRIIRRVFAQNGTPKADQVYQEALYRFHIAGQERGVETPLEYARHKIDPQFGADFESFMRMYLRLKYTNENMRAEDYDVMNSFSNKLSSSILGKLGFFKSIAHYFNLFRASRFFMASSAQEPEEVVDAHKTVES